MNKKIRYIQLCVFVLLSLCAVNIFAAATIDLKDSVSVAGGSVRVSDLADVMITEGDDEISDIIISRSPALQQRRIITRDQILFKLKEQGIEDKSVMFKGARETQVLRKTKMLPADDLVNHLQAYIFDRLSGNQADYIIEPARDIEGVLVADSDVEIEVMGEDIYSQPQTVTLIAKISYSDQEYVKKPFSMKIRKFAQVVVANNIMERDVMISEKDLSFRKEELIPQLNGAFFSFNDVAGKRVRTGIESGQVILDRMINEPEAVQRRSMVTLIYETENMKIVTKVQARQSGRIGDVITVRNPDTKKEYPALITGIGAVKYLL